MPQVGGGGSARIFEIICIKTCKPSHISSEVMNMQKKYKGLTELINAEEAANKYYQSLPNYVKEQIDTRADSVNSFASLKDYAENLTRGDN